MATDITDVLDRLTVSFEGASRLEGEQHFDAFQQALGILVTVLHSLYSSCSVDFYIRPAERFGLFRHKARNRVLLATIQPEPTGESFPGLARALYDSEECEFVARIDGRDEIEILVCADPIYFRFLRTNQPVDR